MTQLALPAACGHAGCGIGRPCDHGGVGRWTRRGRRVEMVRRVPKKKPARAAVLRLVRPVLPPAETWAEPPRPRGPEPFAVEVVLTLGKDWARELRVWAIRRAAEGRR